MKPFIVKVRNAGDTKGDEIWPDGSPRGFDKRERNNGSTTSWNADGAACLYKANASCTSASKTRRFPDPSERSSTVKRCHTKT